MKSFLKDVAKDLLKRYGHNLSNVVVVFPGKRARLFMGQYLAQEAGRPVWAPQYKTIDELFLQLSPYRKADTIVSVCTLYNIYASLVPDAESIDEFYSWGEIILSDFDDIDKHLAPAEKIFRNVYDLQSISTDYITPEQEAALREFFKNFSVEGNSELKKRFLRLWDIMPDLYNGLKDELKKQGMLYSGALYREVVESPKGSENSLGNVGHIQQEKTTPTYCFVGFNVLDESEEKLFRYYQEQNNALFYWDYDEMYIHDAQWEAGLFINHNMRMFPNALDVDHFDNLRHLKDVTFIATSTNNAQSRYIPQWINEHLTDNENETAVVLADEHALGSVLHSIPEEKPELINVTMGYPLCDTPVFSFLNALMALYIDGYDENTGNYRFTFVEKLKRHPYYPLVEAQKEKSDLLFAPKMLTSSEVLDRMMVAADTLANHFSTKEERDVYEQLYAEALFKCHLIFTQFQDALPPVGNSTLRRLLRQVLTSTSIPFHGEPAIGMQVMGLLETRNIDFSHILMLNVGEGILPKKVDETSLIPYTLKESFGLTTIKHRISVFAYYFYRLIARAEHLTLMYNENASGISGNEMSRFMRQMMAETDIPIRYVRLMPENDRQHSETSMVVQKTEEMATMLREKYVNNSRHSLSPTAINTYLTCPLQFYYKYIANIYIDDKPEDGITPALMGTIFHDASQLFYEHLMKHYVTRTINREMLDNVLKDKETKLDVFVNISLILNYFTQIKEEEKGRIIQKYAAMPLQELLERTGRYFAEPKHAGQLVGLNHIIHSVLKQYLVQLIRYDMMHAPFTLEGLEIDRYMEIEIAPNEKIRTGGRIDRLESRRNESSDEHYVVVDYKTGGGVEPVNGIEAIFDHKNKQDGYFLQTFIYALAVQDTDKTHGVQPTLFYVNKAGNAEAYDRTLRLGTKTKNEVVTDIESVREHFTDKLKDTMQKILSPTEPFAPTENTNACQYCKYKDICK